MIHKEMQVPTDNELLKSLIEKFRVMEELSINFEKNKS